MATENSLTKTAIETNVTPGSISLFFYLGEGYTYIFGRPWPAWLGGLLLGVTNFAMFAYASVWFIYGGFNLAGSWLISFTGITPAANLVNPLTNTGFVHDGAIILGAFISCLMASSFRIRMPRRKIRLAEGFIGGLIMGVGAMLAPGCNIGGFFSAIASFSLSGFVMLFALAGGAYSGVLIARWRLKREIRSGTLATYERKVLPAQGPHSFAWKQPIIGLLVLLVSLALFEVALGYDSKLGVFLMFGLVFGFILQRTGFCFTASFRDMFTSGDGRLARGVIVAIGVAMLGFSILQGTGIRQPFVLPVGWHTLVGGYIFGLGMVIAGGCASGTLFRIGEGSIQLLFALPGGMLGAALFSTLLKAVNFQYGSPIWLVDTLGWHWALFSGFGFLAVWLIVVQWNEIRRRKIR
ncbi:YeeE/YedE thiosulfate transporter family protein [Chloroflexota bacterium]